MRTQIFTILCFLLFSTTICHAQVFKHLNTNNGLSNRRTSKIIKDHIGYMWFMSNEGLDRYDGKKINHYSFTEEKGEYSYPLHLGWQYLNSKGELWVVGKKGRLFYYDRSSDRFRQAFKHHRAPLQIDYSFIDWQDRIWQCTKDSILLYNSLNGQIHQAANPMRERIVAVEQTNDNHYFLATTDSISFFKWKDGKTTQISTNEINEIQTRFSTLFFDKNNEALYIGTLGNGVMKYDLQNNRLIQLNNIFSDVSVTHIRQLDSKQLLIATEGRGLFVLNTDNGQSTPFLNTANISNYNGVMLTNIDDIYIDEKKRVWTAHYPDGITIIDKRYSGYHRIKGSTTGKLGLANGHVHSIIEDSEGNLWMGTSNGISVFHEQEKLWHNMLQSKSTEMEQLNSVFLTLCEVSPTEIWAGGYTSEIYSINKKTKAIKRLMPSKFTTKKIRREKYIRHIMKDSQGCIWIGGYYNLKCYNPTTQEFKHYPGISYIINMAECDENNIWIGTAAGLLLLNRHSGEFQTIDLKVEMAQINSLYQASDGILYIGTNGSGLIEYDHNNGATTQYHKENSALVSNCINTILPEKNEKLMISTENGVTHFSTQKKTFKNWTKEQGLTPSSFNISSGIIRKNGDYIFGSSEGLLILPENAKMPLYDYKPMIFSDFKVAYQLVLPGSKNSPITEDINQVKALKLKHKQNTFSFKISDINYDNPGNITYYWLLENKNDRWSKVPIDNMLQFTNLAPGKYQLLIRGVSREEPYQYLEERKLQITITPPFWRSKWGNSIYFAIIISSFLMLYNIQWKRKKKYVTKEKTDFFINTAHDLRTPLTLIKAPLEEIIETKQPDSPEADQLRMALRNVENLLHMTTNFIDLEHSATEAVKLHLTEVQLHNFISDECELFRSYAITKHISYNYPLQKEEEVQTVWIDKEKIKTILKNILTNAFKYTQKEGSITVSFSNHEKYWEIQVQDSGMGIPKKEQKKLFKDVYRASNAVSSKTTGNGLGLMLIKKLIKMHKGTIDIKSSQHKGTTVTFTIPHHLERMKDIVIVTPPKNMVDDKMLPELEAKSNTSDEHQTSENRPKLILAEDNQDLREYLVNAFKKDFNICPCTNGKEVMKALKVFDPELIITDVMMPEMRGDELCMAVKSNLETSHIPVILLTAMGDEGSIIQGLNIGADEYIVKPFNMNILRASINNILHNREMLRKKFAQITLEAKPTEDPPSPAINPLDWKFITTLQQYVEDNADNTELNVDQLCTAMHMSRTSLYNKLKALTGEAPADFIRNIRLKAAIKMLESGELNITEIAERTGFCDSKHFREVFKKHYGVSPSKYLKNTDQ